jgi:hypothetical protein
VASQFEKFKAMVADGPGKPDFPIYAIDRDTTLTNQKRGLDTAHDFQFGPYF